MTMKKLNEMLKSNGIEEINHNYLDDKFNNPMEQLGDLFGAFGKIFSPMDKRVLKTKLSSGAETKIFSNEGKIFVSSSIDHLRNYPETFKPLKP